MKAFFYWTRQERMGALSLFVGCVLVWLMPWRKILQSETPKFDATLLKAFIEDQSEARAEQEQRPRVVKPFDPNDDTLEQLVAAGVPAHLAKTMINYREKVRPFQSVGDLKKLYTMSPEWYDKLAPYAIIKDEKTKPSQKSTPKFAVDLAEKEDRIIMVFNFDPNSISFDSLLLLGCSEKNATTILNFRSHGGQFHQPSDLLKIYGLSKRWYGEVEQLIDIPEQVKESPKPNAVSFNTESKIPEIDINKADAMEWQVLRGIGPKLSARIVKFRERLGGFVQIDQVGETFGLPDSTFQSIKPYLVKLTEIQKIQINVIDEASLKQHPYVHWKAARAIIKFRENHGPFQSRSDFMQIRILSEEEHRKLAPYLEFSIHPGN